MPSDLIGLLLPYLDIYEQKNLITSGMLIIGGQIDRITLGQIGSIVPSYCTISYPQFLRMIPRQQSLVRDLDCRCYHRVVPTLATVSTVGSPMNAPRLKILSIFRCPLPFTVLPDSLEVLKCNDVIAVELPPLPDSLTEFICCSSGLVSLPALPPHLRILDCSDNSELDELPELPESLIELNCRGTYAVLPAILPPYLQVLKCGDNNELLSLPDLPPTLRVLDCTHCEEMDELPVLPDSLTELRCTTLALTSLPTLPPNLRVLNCFGNHLTVLPPLPSTLTVLNIRRNNLTQLPLLPDGLLELVCGFSDTNRVVPPLPVSLLKLSCMQNYIPTDMFSRISLLELSLWHCDFEGGTLPILPNSLRMLEICSSEPVHLPEHYHFPPNLEDLRFMVGVNTKLPLPSDLPRNLKSFTYQYKNAGPNTKEMYMLELPELNIREL